jgi:hypothetical protein
VAKPDETAPQEDVAAMVDRLLRKLRRGNPTLTRVPTASSSMATGITPRPVSSVAQGVAPRPVSSVVRTVPPRNDWGALPSRSFRHTFTGTRQGAAWGWVGLGVLLGTALTQWPYPRTCGWWLLGYSIAVVIVVVTGMRGALLSWKSRLGLAHAIALGTILWGLVLAAQEILPRVGYARTSATWECAALDRADRPGEPVGHRARDRVGGVV